ncbi:hypothetical protein FRC00_013896 [Tulasnella sp. 408]|nr:hypothetical protein FRC00_013896 [Tulasnella sp. 408]
MFRSTSPAPSIAPSFESTAPSAWTNIDPLRTEDNHIRRSNSLPPENEHQKSGEVNFQPRVDSGAGMGIGTFNTGWGWGDSGENSADEDDVYGNKTSRRNKGNMLSRVFKSETGSLNVSGQFKSGSSRSGASGHAWSDSTDLLHPYKTGSDIQSSTSHISSTNNHRSKTPPARLATGSAMTSKSPPSSKKRGSKNRRPMSLNLNMTEPAPPPPTFNNLPPETRADLLKKNRKLQQMLGPDYYNPNAAASSHRNTILGDSDAIGGLVAGMAGLGKKAGSRKSTERKRRRDRLVKLHRFLGSNVPAEAVLGTDAPGERGLPAPAVDAASDDSDNQCEDGVPKWWKGLKKPSTGGTELGASSRSDWNRTRTPSQQPMTEQDRALNVRRKAKMEKMFGANPPQGMYVLRTKAEEGEISEDEVLDEEPVHLPSALNSLEFLRHSHSLNSLNYLVDKEDRESLRNLFTEFTKQDPLSDLEEDIVFAPPEDLDEEEDDDDLRDPRQPKRHTRQPFRRGSVPPTITLNLPHSPLLSSPLASLSPTWRSSPISTSSTARLFSGPVSPIGPSTLTKKPSQSSLTSLDADQVAVDGFQQRRKRAAKLTKFFGTDYRSLFGEVLESIESGVRDDQTKGTLTEEEAKARPFTCHLHLDDLLTYPAELFRKLQRLRAKQDSILPSSSSR